jgi:tetratricopeptide (TPR) repeat protein
MLVDKYIVEGYEDWIHSYGYFKLTHIFVEKYKMIIIINDKCEITNMFRSKKPENTYSVVMEELTSPIEKIEVSNEFVEKAYTILCAKEKVKVDENELKNLINWDNFLSNSEKSEIKFNEAYTVFRKGKYEDAIRLFSDIIEFTTSEKHKATSYYNIACGYALLKQKDNLVKYLHQAVNNGYTNWQHIILDNDFKKYIDEPELVEIVRKAYISNPDFREINLCSMGYKLPCDLAYLDKHKIEMSEAMLKICPRKPISNTTITPNT